MSPPPAPSHWKNLLQDLGGLSVPLGVAFALLALAAWLESPAGNVRFPLEWLAALDADQAASLLGVAAQLVAGVLAIVITVAAIVVELAANRYTSRITQLFVREPVNFAVMGLYVVTTLLCLWLSGLPDLAEGDTARVPRAGLVVGLGLVTVCLLALLPYFGFLFRFLAPTNVIARIRRDAIGVVQRALTRTVPGARADVIESIEELEDVARSAREHSDRSISMAAISALAGLVREYVPLREKLPDAWFEIEGSLARDPDFVSMAPVAVAEIRAQRLWLETKVLRQYLALYGESLGDARDVANLIALETRQLGVEAIGRHPNLLALVVRFFNSYLRAAVNARDQRTAYYVLDQYRLLGEATLVAGERARTLEIADHLRFYGQLGYGMDQPFLLEAVAYDLAGLVERAVEAGRPEAAALLDLFLQVDREPESPEQEERLRGVRRAQVQLATFFLAQGDEAHARRIFEDMKDERPERLAAVRDELLTEERAQYWEFTDRGVNFSYLPPEQRAHLARFFAWFGRALGVLGLFIGLGCGAPPTIAPGGPLADWPAYGGDAGGMRWSPLEQVTPANVAALEIAWIHRSGDVLDGTRSLGKSSLQVTPILVDGTLYACTPRSLVFALDPETGRERWRYDPGVDATRYYIVNCRGVSHWLDTAAPERSFCRRRILFGTLDARLIALDAASGLPCPGFGASGSVDLGAGIGERAPGEYGVTSPPAVIGDRIVVGSMVLDNRRTDSPGGVVRAFDARSGALVWAWDPVFGRRDRPPQPDVGGVQTWTRGTTNAWAPLSVDAERGLVFVPTGNSSPDYYGGQRNGLDHYSSSVVALDVATGTPRWHFQTVHHDVWDYDVPAQPTLFEWPGPGGPVPALVQATKLGHLFVLDRTTGVPLLPVEERPVPQAGAVPGETLAPTQPFPVRPASLHPATFGADEAFGFTPWDRAACREAIAGLRSDGIFTPPSAQGSVQYPGMAGGMNWGGVAVDPERDLVIANTQRIATRIRLLTRDEVRAKYGEQTPDYGVEPQEGTPYALERAPLLSPLGAPCNPPPWGTLAAIDLATGALRWEVPLGTTRDLAPWPLWLDTGTPNLGGPLATASGLVFIGATTDFFLRAFDVETGQELWKARLPTAAHATPMTYRLRPDGRQYVVVAAGGHGLLGTPPGDALIAFALP
jgi:quinoprotein glucose dehydrogenase